MTGVVSISQEAVQRTLTDTMRAYVGAGKRYAVSTVADASLVCESSIKNYMSASGTPGLPGFLRLLAVLGPEWGSTLTRLAGFELVPSEPGAVSEYAINHAAAAVLQKIAEGLKDDGRIDHLERAEMRPHIEELHALTGAWLHDEGQQK